jgi:hypothetical protein
MSIGALVSLPTKVGAVTLEHRGISRHLYYEAQVCKELDGIVGIPRVR